MCKRHMQEIREHEGEIRKCARDIAEIREHVGDIGHMQETICRRTGNMKER
jgi:hypothetical protein